MRFVCYWEREFLMNRNWAFLVEVENDLEADIICGFLQEKGISAKKVDSSSIAGTMRIIGGQAFEVQVYVPEPFLKQAQKALRDFDTEPGGSRG